MENQVEHPVSESQVEGLGEHPETDATVPSGPGAVGLPVEEVEVPAAFDALELEPESEMPSEAMASLRLEIESLKQDIFDLKGQLDERNGQYVRIAADFENFRNRTQREKSEQEQRVKCTTILELLSVVDNFERARSQLKPEGEEAKQLHNSYQGIYKQFVEALKRLGVAPMRAEGKEFDPMLHEAMMRQPTDEYPEGTIMEEFQRGYLLGDRVLRHAMVKVAAAPEPVITSEENNNPIPES